LEKKGVKIEMQLFEKVSPSHQSLLGEQAQKYGKFMGMPVTVSSFKNDISI
jgi:hypothetical protein